MGTIATTHCFLLKVKDAFIVVFSPWNTWLTSLVPPQRLRRRAIWSRERGHITQAHRHEITASVCLSHPHKVCVCSCLFSPLADRNRVGNYGGTNLMKTLFIWCSSLSYHSLTGYQGGWWIVFPSERQWRGDVCFLPPCCVLHHSARSSLQHAVCVHNPDVEMISSGQSETSESWINFWIINLWPLAGKPRACGESVFSLFNHSDVFLQTTVQISTFLEERRVLKPR